MLDFVNRFPKQTFERYDNAYIDRLGEKWNITVPQWLRAIVTTLFCAAHHHVLSCKARAKKEGIPV